MPSHAQRSERADPLVAAWLIVLTVMVLVMIVVGGLTRLTDSGLSITEWRPVTGALPPLSAAGWQAEFDKYREIPEYLVQNRGMSMAEFQTIYWWEWSHRQLGRAIGLTVLIPLIVFAAMGRLRGAGLARGLGLFALVCLQGAIGWWMVASGLVERVDVSQHRLAVHLGVAFVILGLLAWSVLAALGAPRIAPAPNAGKTAWGRWAISLATLVFIQIIAGAYVAGLDAGRVLTDWPRMGGAWVPAQYAALEPWWRNVLDNRAAVQFNHRVLGYVVAVMGLLVLTAGVRGRIAPPARVWAILFGGACVAQALLGVVTLVHAAPLALAAAHQLGAAILFALSVAWARASIPPPTDLAAPAPHHPAPAR